MNSRLQTLTAAQLRNIIIVEMRKFAMALEYGSTFSDLQEMREYIKEVADLLTIKEKEEFAKTGVEISPQSNIKVSA